MTVGLRLNWTSPGPVASAFMRSSARVQAINGPIGSGKTSAVMMKAVFLARAQRPSTRDGVRKFKLCVVRDTYRQLWKTTIPSWWRWVPQEVGEWVGATDAPARHTIRFDLKGADGRVDRIEFTAEFVALGEHRVEEVLRGYEPTAFYLNELDMLPEEALIFARGRAGRYPTMDEGGPSWWGVLSDLNAPLIDSWAYERLFLARPEGFDLYRQPGGRSPRAENLANLPPGYYDEQAVGQPDWYVRRMIDNEPAFGRAGKLVFPEFSDSQMVPREDLKPARGLPLIIGADAGLTPAAVINQHLPNGQWRALDELVTAPGEHVGAVRFGERLAQLLRERYPGWPTDQIAGWADPAALYGADDQAGEQNWIQIVSLKSGVRFRAAPSNKLVPRFEAVRRPMTRLIDGQPGCLVSPRAVTLRGGYAGGYRFREIGAGLRYEEKPEKNHYSHVCDADQYAKLGGGEYHEVMERNSHRGRATLQTHAETDEEPRGRYRGRPAEAISE